MDDNSPEVTAGEESVANLGVGLKCVAHEDEKYTQEDTLCLPVISCRSLDVRWRRRHLLIFIRVCLQSESQASIEGRKRSETGKKGSGNPETVRVGERENAVLCIT